MRRLTVVGWGLLAACGGVVTQTGTDSGSGGDAGPVGDAGPPGDAGLTNDGGIRLDGGAVARPPYNTGNGFFVLNGKLYDANGNEFRFRGIDRNHYDSNSSAGLAKSGANVVRIFVETNYGATWAQLANIVQTQHIANKEVPIVTAPNTTSGTGTSCNTDAGVLSDVVANSWVATASTWTPLDHWMIANIANEWGPSNSTVWRDSYVSAIAAMRDAGYLGTLLIDSGGCGQDLDDLVNYSGAVFDSDPQRNIMFALHPYGSVNDYQASIAHIANGNPTVVTLTGSSTCHPFAPSYCPALGMTNTYSGLTEYRLSGVQGMTQINGNQPAPQNVGGASGAWTVTLNVDSTGFSAYAGGGTIIDYNGNHAVRLARLAALASTTGAAYAVTEFGPGNDIGPSPTLVSPLQLVNDAEANKLGWLAWAWDDNNLANAQTNNEWFGLTYQAGVYTREADLTMYGQQIVEGCTNPAPGGCGCPDGTPLPPYHDSNNPNAPPPAVYSTVAPGCSGTPAPTYQAASLKLATPASIF
jgi:hypothetical protein